MILINRKDLPEANTTCKTCGRKYRLCNRCLKLRSMGLESWREYCDCIECYQVYAVLSKDMKDITKDEYDYIMRIELPEGQEYTKEVKDKFAELKDHFEPKNSNRVISKTDNKEDVGHEESNPVEPKRYEFGFGKKRNNKIPYNGK